MKRVIVAAVAGIALNASAVTVEQIQGACRQAAGIASDIYEARRAGERVSKRQLQREYNISGDIMDLLDPAFTAGIPRETHNQLILQVSVRQETYERCINMFIEKVK